MSAVNGEVYSMGIKTELKTRTIQYEDIVGATCDFCGKEISCKEGQEDFKNCMEYHKW